MIVMSDKKHLTDSEGEESENGAAPEEQAEEIVTALSEEAHEHVVSQFTTEFKSEFTEGYPPSFELYLSPEPEPLLSEHWDGLTALYGSFEEIDSIDSQSDDAETDVTVNLEFQKQTHPIRLTLTPAGEISDLTFVSGYEPPEYLDESTFEERDVTVETDDLDLGGTLTVPDNDEDIPGVVLLHGAGGTDRDYTAGANKILKDLAWGLADQGIASLRYDKRNFVTDVPPEEFDLESVVVDDAVEAVDRLADVEGVDSDRIAVAGHSLGGTCSTYIAERHDEVAGIVNLDGPSVGSVTDVLFGSIQEHWEQQDKLSEYGREQLEKVESEAERIENGNIEPDETLFGQHGAWIQSYDCYTDDWLDATASLTIPRFIVVTGRHVPNQAAHWEETIRAEMDETDTKIAFYEDMNHYFQRGDERGSFLEPIKVRKPPAETVVSDVAEWISDTI